MFITNKNITESLVRSLQNSFTSQTNCEITLMCEGKTLRCHRHVLVLHSTHFNNLFKQQTDFPSAIAVVNMKFNHLKAMVDYMYFGRIKLQEDSDEMNQIIKCAEDLGLSALVTFITEFLKNSKHKSMNGSSANLSNNDLNGDDSLLKRKRASDISSRVNPNDSIKKPKLNEGLNKTSTPLRDTKTDVKSIANSDVKVSNSDNSETLINDKKRKSDDDEADDEDRRIKDEEDERKRKIEENERLRKKEEDERKRREDERKRKEQEKQKLEEERRKKAEEEKRKASEEQKRVDEENERLRLEEEKNKKMLEKKKEEEAARKAEEEKNKKETTKCDESASTKSCAVCNKQYKDNIDHRKVLEGVTFDKKCVIGGCLKTLPFRRALIDHLLKAHKIDVCDG